MKSDLRDFVKNCQENSKLPKKAQKRALYMKIKLCFIVAGNIKLPQKSCLLMKFYQAGRIAEEA